MRHDTQSEDASQKNNVNQTGCTSHILRDNQTESACQAPGDTQNEGAS